MQIHFIRHGQTNWNEERRVQGQTNSVLTDLGKQQASNLNEKMLAEGFDKVYCSSSTRTRQTADCLFAGSNLDIDYWDSLREIHLGPWEGQLYADIEIHSPESYEHFWSTPHLFDVAGAETFADIQKRGVDAVQDIVENHPNQKIALVSHGAIIKSILSFFEGRHLSKLWDAPQMHNCAHSIVEFDADGNASILQYADVAY